MSFNQKIGDMVLVEDVFKNIILRGDTNVRKNEIRIF